MLLYCPKGPATVPRPWSPHSIPGADTGRFGFQASSKLPEKASCKSHGCSIYKTGCILTRASKYSYMLYFCLKVLSP